jgi:hypothetical protein
MTISSTYWWQKTYDDAVLEMDLQQVPGRVVEAQKAIEERLRSCIVYGASNTWRLLMPEKRWQLSRSSTDNLRLAA